MSSSSGLHKIYPIYDKVRPAKAPLYSSREDILMFLKQIGRNLKVVSSNFISSIISIYSINFMVLPENGFSAYLQDSQAISYEQIERLSGMHKP